MTDQLPSGVTFVSSAPSVGTYNSATGVWTVGPLAVGAQATLGITTTVTSASNIVNTAFVSHSDQYDPTSGNNFATTSANANAADLIVLKTVDNPTPSPGVAIVFTVTVRNSGPATATGVTVTDLLPTGVAFVSATASQGTYNSATGLWTVGTVTTTTPATLQIHATAPQNQQTNVAQITHSDQVDQNTSNNVGTATVTPPGADLMVSKSADKQTPKFGENVTFTVTVKNNGPDGATNVQVSDSVPGGTTLVSATPSQGTYDSTMGTWALGSLANQATATLVIVVTVATPSQIQNSAYIARSDQFDSNTGNNNASVTITPVPPSVTAAVSQTSTCGANGVRYTESVTSLSLTNGPPNATITVTLNYGGGDSNAFATPSVIGTFATNGAGAGTFTGSTSIDTNSAIATYPTSVFLTVAAGPAYVASTNATLTNGTAASCTQSLTLTAAVSQSAFCGDSYPLLTYVENVTSLTLTGGPASATLSVRLDYTGGGIGSSSPPSAFSGTNGQFTTDAGGHGTFSDTISFDGPSPSNFPTAVTVVVLNGATEVKRVTLTAGNGLTTPGTQIHC